MKFSTGVTDTYMTLCRRKVSRVSPGTKKFEEVLCRMSNFSSKSSCGESLDDDIAEKKRPNDKLQYTF